MAEPQIISPRKSKAKRAYLVLAALALGVLAVYYIPGYLTRNEVTTDDAQIDADVVPIASRVSGVVLHVNVKDNQRVEANKTVIAEIDPADYNAKVAVAQADADAADDQADAAVAQLEIVKSTSRGGLTSAQAIVQGTSASVHSAAAQVQAAEAGLSRAQNEEKKAEDDLARAKKLHDAGAVSGQQLEAAQVARDTAKDAVDLARANLAAARDAETQAQSRVTEAAGRLETAKPIDRQVAAADAAMRVAQARAKSAHAQLDLAKLQAGYTKILAPISGYASKLAVHEGQMVQPGQTLLMIVPATTYVVANFKETQLARIAAGDEAEISVDALGGKTFRGKVDSVSPATGARFSMLPPDNATGNFVKVVQRVPVKIDFDEGQDAVHLHAGLSVEVKVTLR